MITHVLTWIYIYAKGDGLEFSEHAFKVNRLGVADLKQQLKSFLVDDFDAGRLNDETFHEMFHRAMDLCIVGGSGYFEIPDGGEVHLRGLLVVDDDAARVKALGLENDPDFTQYLEANHGA